MELRCEWRERLGHMNTWGDLFQVAPQNLQDRKINSYILQTANMTLIPLVWTDHMQARMTPTDLR